MRGSGRSLGPVLALLAALGAVASCGGDDKDPDTLCKDACDALNNCGQSCKPAEYVDACKKALDSGDKARKAEVECLTSTSCDKIETECYGSHDLCAGVSCQDPEQCNPDTGKCQEAECQPRIQGKECTGNKFCYVAFCVDPYPRTYVFTFKDVLVPATKPMSTDPWDEGLGGQPDIYPRIDRNDKQVARGDTLTDRLSSDDLGAKLEVTINRGDKVVFGIWDEDDAIDEYVLGCSIDNPDTPEDDFPATLRTPGINCRDQDGNGFNVEVDPR